MVGHVASPFDLSQILPVGSGLLVPCSLLGENIPVMPTFHPAYLLRNESSKKDAWQDLQQVMARFGKYHRR